MGQVVTIRPEPPRTVSQETVRELEDMLSQAKSGEIQGIAYVALHKGQAFSIATVGAALTAPTYCLGAVSILKAALIKLIV
jgi:hypothetical protein